MERLRTVAEARERLRRLGITSNQPPPLLLLDATARPTLSFKTSIFRRSLDNDDNEGEGQEDGEKDEITLQLEMPCNDDCDNVDTSNQTQKDIATSPPPPQTTGGIRVEGVDLVENGGPHTCASRSRTTAAAATETTCAICLTRLQEGDVVGNISCGHVFHKECLKDWLPRRNTCPLCQRRGIAMLSL
jgi:hypothetical protein